MTEKYNNNFRFSLSQEDLLLCEVIFNADDFNPLTRYSIDIRDILPRSITKLQKVLSKKSYDTTFSNDLDLYEYYQKMLSLYPNEFVYGKKYNQQYPTEFINGMRYNPQPITYEVTDFNGDLKVIKGVECKIGLYINEKTIVERVFFVDGFNPVARLSFDIVEVVDEIVNEIFSKIKKNDLKNIWDDYDLINYGGYSINEIRDFPYGKRQYVLRNLKTY